MLSRAHICPTQPIKIQTSDHSLDRLSKRQQPTEQLFRTVSLATPEFHVFPDVAVFGRSASGSHIDARTTMGATFLQLSAERQKDRSYIIRELAPRS